MARSQCTATALLMLTLAACEGRVGSLAPEFPEHTVASSPEGGPSILTFTCTPDTAPAPHEVTCTWTTSHPDGVATTCTLDVGADGSAEVQGACTEVRTHTFVLPTDATTQVRLSVQDARNKVVEAALELETTINQPPILAAFTASPDAAFVPHLVAFTWQLSDPEEHGASCELDLESDGTVDLTVPDCITTTSIPAELTEPGTRTVTLTATDAYGNRVTGTTVIVSTPPPTVDVSVAKVEFGQTIVGEALRLVGGKKALLRAHIVSNESGTAAPEIRVSASVGGSVLGTLGLVGPASVPTTVSVSTLSQSYVTELPAAWIQPGLELTLSIDPDNVLPEVDEANNTVLVKPSVGAATVLHLTAVPVVHQGVTASIPSGHRAAIERIWPIQQVQSQTRAPYTFAGVLSANDGGPWEDLLQAIASVRSSDGSTRYYYGFVDVSYGSGIAGIGYIGNPAATGRNDSATTLVHELGHNFHRRHAPCGTTGDPNYPYANARLGSWGYDSNNMRLVSPTANYDLMSYCDPSWVSDYTYGAVQAYLESNPPDALVQSGSQPMMLVSGSIGPGGATLLPLFRVTAAGADVDEGRYTLRLHTTTGPRDVTFGTREIEDSDQQHFTLLIPDPGDLTGAEIRLGGETLGAWKAAPTSTSPRPPELHEAEGRLNVRWDASTSPFLRVQHVGSVRTTLTLWMRGGEVSLPLGELPSGGEWEVGLSNGLHALRWRMKR